MMITDLSGQWELRLDSGKSASEPLKCAEDYDDEMILPDTVSAAKKTKEHIERETGFLCDPYLFEGFAWFGREITLSDEFLSGDVFTLKFERSRITRVWIDGDYVGEDNSLCTPHIFDVTKFVKKKFYLCVLVSNVDYPTKGGHMTSPDTQTNWNGILGEISLTSENRGVLRGFAFSYDEIENSVTVSFESDASLSAVFSAEDILPETNASICEGKNSFSFDVPENAVKWSEFTPKTYLLKISVQNGNRYEKSFGIRRLSVFRRENGSFGFEINGTETIMRGKHDGMIFPMTGYAPMDKESWLRVLGVSKSYGINHYRFHTCTPPDAAFEAADELGIYMEPELPFWGTIHAADDKDCNLGEQEYLINEGLRIIREFSHHPSFVMMSLGNELWGSADRLSEIIGIFKERNSDILYTGGSNNFQFYPSEVKNEDFFVGVRFDKEYLIRGSYAMCDAPQGFIQTDRPNTSHDYDIFFDKSRILSAVNENGEIEIQYGTGVKKVKTFGGGGYIPEKPVISHEVGQYYSYPDYGDIPKFTGVLKPVNLEVFKEKLESAGMGEFAHDSFYCSGKLAAQCYKLEIEAARRSRCLSGYQLLDIQDFTGQGTASVGILNAFMENKGIISQREWNFFNGDTVITASFDSFVLYDTEEFSAEIIVSHFGNEDISYGSAEVFIFGDRFEFSLSKVKSHGVYSLGTVHVKIITDRQREEKLRISMGKYENEYTLYLFPEEKTDINSYNSDNLIVTTDKEKAVSEFSDGKNVLLFTNDISGIESVYCTDFWCYGMFSAISRSVGKPEPVGTLGLSIQNSHKALYGFVSETYTTPKWYDIIVSSKCAVLDKTDIHPIVRTIDNTERNHRLSILFEAKAENGKIIVCTLDPEKINISSAVSAYVKSICEYASSENFVPSDEISAEKLSEILS